MSRVRVNYKSDLPPVAVKFKINGSVVNVPSHDFVIRFFVDGAPGTSFECAHKGDEYINCAKTADDILTCYINNHKFGCGRLCCEFIDLSADSRYKDKVLKTVTPSALDVVLVEGAGDDSIEVLNVIFGYEINEIAEITAVESSEDGGNNVVTITQTNGEEFSFNVKNGNRGNGISSIEATESQASGGNNVITITETNGTETTFNVKNGNDGANGVSLGDVEIADNLTTNDATKVLSAKQGKKLKDNVQAILNALGEFAFPNGKPEISWGGDTPTPPTPVAYDAEVEYIESSGTQFIDTLENLQTACSTYIKMSITKAISSNSMVFGAFMDGIHSITPKAQLYINSSQKWTYSRTENIAVSGITSDAVVSLNTIYELTATTQAQTNDLKAYLFARNNDGNEFLPIDGMRLYGCTMTKDNVLVRDFIPVRVGQVGYLYDRVSGELFGNAGTGNFILGNDKNE